MLTKRKNKHKKILLIIAFVFIWLIICTGTVFLCKIIFSQPKETPKIILKNSQLAIKLQPIIIKPTNPTLTDQTAPKAKSVPILMYHFFYNSADGGIGEDNNWVDTVIFDQQMKYLVDNDYYFPTWDEIKQYIAGTISLPEKSIVITDDDGSATFFNLAVPILTKYKIPVTSFIITSWTDPKNITTDKTIVTFMSHSHAMHTEGCEGGYGGLFRCLDHDKAIADLLTSKNIVEGGDVFCYPFGDYNEQEMQELQEAGFSLAVTTEYGKATPGDNPLLLPRIRISRSTNLDSFIDAIN